MKEQLRSAAALGVEHRIAGYDAIAYQEAVEILAYALGEAFLGSAVGTAGAAQYRGIAHELLVEQRHRPAAHHSLAHRGIDRLQRVVPVAVSVAQQMRAWHEARAHR